MCHRPAILGLVRENTFPAPLGTVWVAVMVSKRSIRSPVSAASTSAEGKHSWISRSVPSAARTSGQHGWVSPENTMLRPAKSTR